MPWGSGSFYAPRSIPNSQANPSWIEKQWGHISQHQVAEERTLASTSETVQIMAFSHSLMVFWTQNLITWTFCTLDFTSAKLWTNTWLLTPYCLGIRLDNLWNCYTNFKVLGENVNIYDVCAKNVYIWDGNGIFYTDLVSSPQERFALGVKEPTQALFSSHYTHCTFSGTFCWCLFICTPRLSPGASSFLSLWSYPIFRCSVPYRGYWLSELRCQFSPLS